MKQKKKILLVFTLIMAMLCCPLAVFGADTPVDEVVGFTESAPLNASAFQAMEVTPGVEMQVMRSAAGITAMVRTFADLTVAVETDVIDSAYLMNNIQMESSLMLTKDFTIETGGVDRYLYSAPNESHFTMNGTGITLDLSDSVILDANHEGPGGIQSLGQHFTIIGGTIQNGTASSAIRAEGIESGNVTLTGTSILNQANSTNGKGGAVYFSGQNGSGLILEDCIIKGNTAKGTGSAIYFAAGGTFEIYNTVIEDNTNLSGIGGAIYYPENFGNTLMRNVTLNNNSPTSISSQDYTTAEYTITYYPNTGIGAPIVDSGLEEGTAYTIIDAETSSFVKENFLFKSWNTQYDGSGDTYEFGEIITVEEDLELYARWQYNGVKYYSISYHPNTGEGSGVYLGLLPGMEHIIKDPSELANPVSKPNYRFTEWNTEKDGTGTAYHPGDIYVVTEENIMLYAQWDFALGPFYAVVYHAGSRGEGGHIDNGISGGEQYTIKNAEEANITPKLSSYALTAWEVTEGNDTITTGEILEIGAEIEITGKLILTGIWTRIN